jgi:hypothetical protein
MAESKYGKYIITKTLSEAELKARGRNPSKREEGAPFSHALLWLDEKIIPGAFYMEAVMIEPGSKRGSQLVKPHIHDYDEILGFMGTDQAHPDELNGEIELYLDDEKHILTKTCFVYAPKGFKHCPLSIVRVDKPIIHFSVARGGQYLWEFI